MILEAIRHILTPASREVRALGYVREAIAINARYNRCRTEWAGHLARCRLNILAAAKSLPPASTIMIIGSGALHDVPVETLLSGGHELLMVDIIHLPKTRRPYRTSERIRFIEQDVTGLVKNLYQRKSISKTAFALPKSDLVISLNILSQLPLNPEKYARQHHIPLPDDFARGIMADHVKLLRSLAPEILIISDLDLDYRREDEIVNHETILPDIGLAAPVDSWDWHIAPTGELNWQISLTHHVACWHI